MLRRVPAAIAAGVILFATCAIAGCAPGAWEPREAPAAIGEPAAGFVPAVAPTPEATLAPTAGSWEGISPGPGYRVVLLSAGEDAAVATLHEAVGSWADQEGVDLRAIDATGEDGILAIVAAMDENPDLIVVAGEALIDPLSVVSANHLDEAFLIVGAEIAEPTHNVTAVDWTGAGFRGEEAGTAWHYDAATFTPERSRAAVQAGVAAVLTGMTGVVLWID